MKWTIGILVVFLLVYFGAGPIYRAMKKHDYDNLYYGLQDAKRKSGAFYQKDEKRFMSYSEKYVRGMERR
ncbi:MAG TPA: hypothetical protein PLP17_04815 [Oligoflexia bacterium]|nr:hypothetical protein [Oligoflexia bacterium]